MNNSLIKIFGMLGVVLGIIAVLTFSIYPARTLMSAVPAVLSLVLLLIFFIFHYESFRSFSRRRSTQFGFNSIMMIVLFIFIIVVLNLTARLYYARTDMSSTSKFSLAPQTENVVRNLRSEMVITVFGQESSPTFKKALELLEGYRYLNRNIIFSVVDLDRSPLMAKEYGVSQYDSVVVRSESSSIVVQGISEESVTNAVIRATRKKKDKVFFVTGHGERSINDTGRSGMSKAYQRLLLLGYEAAQLTLSSIGSVPEDADLLIISGPSMAFSADDIEKIHGYMARGGRLMGMFDPGYDPSDITAIAGMKVRNAFIIDPSSNLGGKDEKVPLVANYPDSPVTRDFKLTTVYPGAAPLEIGGMDQYYDYIRIVTASSGSRIVENGRAGSEQDGNYVIAATAGKRAGKDVLMLFGDSDFASNAFFDVMGNGNLFLNCVNWAAEEGDLVSITPRKDDFIPLYLTPGQGQAILYVSVAGIPLCIFGAGAFIWWRRKRL